MYLDRVIEDDRRMVESWKRDADGILAFVSVQTTSHTSASAYDLKIVDWSLLCCDRDITLIDRPDYSAQSTGHLIILPRAYLSAIIYPTEWISTPHPVKLGRPSRAIRSAYIRRLGQWALVLKSRHQSGLRPMCDIDTAVGASL
jgi:hypothetical protein